MSFLRGAGEGYASDAFLDLDFFALVSSVFFALASSAFKVLTCASRDSLAKPMCSASASCSSFSTPFASPSV